MSECVLKRKVAGTLRVPSAHSRTHCVEIGSSPGFAKLIKLFQSDNRVRNRGNCVIGLRFALLPVQVCVSCASSAPIHLEPRINTDETRIRIGQEMSVAVLCSRSRKTSGICRFRPKSCDSGYDSNCLAADKVLTRNGSCRLCAPRAHPAAWWRQVAAGGLTLTVKSRGLES